MVGDVTTTGAILSLKTTESYNGTITAGSLTKFQTAGGFATCDPTHAQAAPEGSIDLVIDAVGARATRNAALVAVKPGGVVLHIGLADWASEIDMRKLTLGEISLIGTYTYSTADLRAAASALYEGAFGDLAWVEERSLAEGAQAFRDLDQGRAAAAKIVLRPR